MKRLKRRLHDLFGILFAFRLFFFPDRQQVKLFLLNALVKPSTSRNFRLCYEFTICITGFAQILLQTLNLITLYKTSDHAAIKMS